MYTSTVHISYISQSLMICRTSRKTLPYLFNFNNVMLQWLPFCFYFFQVIGKNQVSVPTHLYKVIMVENDQSELLGLGAFIIPNQRFFLRSDQTFSKFFSVLAPCKRLSIKSNSNCSRFINSQEFISQRFCTLCVSSFGVNITPTDFSRSLRST
jgi:hypothetical protein